MSTVHRLPGPVADSWDWQRHGACRGRDSGQFFHPDGERGSSRTRREVAAKAVCVRCPVRAECAAHALTVQEPYGIWGGFTEHERLQLQHSGWVDLVDDGRGRADVPGLEQRLRDLSPPVDRPLLATPPRQRAATPSGVDAP
ncbi:WhiB family transcriptional regulator [Natronosporangium hydrolyticum]|uniref:Transcriptional regulator WhiB n=1 Tax=Natronosporangium hydrolyticum TaxID=2811111 RepID=A0A895YHN4_9ACTN|nr:WhiB family transcriptional regulator [Natronosporangium hydrolyticum]QSB15582.1 WhiB family transcriptional regulator [Natronosporangium hydrolyticum]